MSATNKSRLVAIYRSITKEADFCFINDRQRDKITSTVHYFGTCVEDALDLAERTEV